MAMFPFNLKCSAVILMVSSLLVAVAFAIGHDAFYQNLNGKPVLNAQPIALINSSLNVSPQQVYLSLGTLFAFLVKSFLGVSVSTVFDQFVWKSIQNTRTRMGIIDDLLSLLKNGFTVLNLQLWKRFPVSMALALICWLLPVVSIISPATLSVRLAPFNEYALKRIPRVDFTSANFASFISVNSPLRDPIRQKMWLSAYRGPTPETQSVVNSVAAQGTILPIEPPAINSSWLVEFYGPAIIYDKVNQTLAADITQNVAQAINRSQAHWSTKPSGAEYSLTRYGYLSWPPESDNLTDCTPFVQNGGDKFAQRLNELGPIPRDPKDGGRIFSTPKKPLNEGSPLSLFVAVFPHAMENPQHYEVLENVAGAVQDPMILRCMLHNASYQANFTYVNGGQTIQVTDKAVLNGIAYLHGASNFEEPEVSTNNSIVHNSQVMESLSYQSIMNAFGNLLIGSISTNMTHLVYPKSGIEVNAVNSINLTTNVLSTTLMETEEMSIFSSTAASDPNPFMDHWKGRSVNSSKDYPRLSDALEVLFENITFSLMSSKMFQYVLSVCMLNLPSALNMHNRPNYTVEAVPDTNVTINSYRNIYIYTRSVLWAAYGTALGVTALCVTAGILLYLSTAGSYSSKFSTIFRVTRGAMVSIDLSIEDYSGLDPLPDHIANAEIATGYNQGYQATTSSTTPLRHPHPGSAASSQLLETTPDKGVHK
ncbi:unnamed protein product [Penicillium nalgiovense]|uniref:Uncharacterized protein n=1 Tax=Penicillium nalgiovense TaxID=60175 RepID=A0A9W4HGE8_PENNA|nr:unnamed protein product [Penicillium nalgiovense]CAG7994340.1 unnamed protein product [Penicillium nalgiovense]CAG8002883.1 unnamed protein product [Penicillium nalgiovense]CAG8022062.1 unnamed protein product [Penicillium nalgiovense]CAG8025963.1 unnamed protein product [Penicillium nalgiovense]